MYSFGVMLLEVLSGRHPLLHWEEKQRMSLANWAKHCYEKGTLSEIVDSELKGQIKPQCLNKFSEVTLSCLLEDGTQRPSMKDIVRVLEFVLQFQDSAVNYEDSSSHSTVPLSDCSENTGLSTTSDGDRSYGRMESFVLIPDDVFSETKNPKRR